MSKADREQLLVEIDQRHRDRCRRIARGELTYDEAQAASDADWEPLVGPSPTQLLWPAFLAGFEESGEDFNGDYVGERLVERLRPVFERWLAEQGAKR